MFENRSTSHSSSGVDALNGLSGNVCMVNGSMCGNDIGIMDISISVTPIIWRVVIVI